jgi:hypothetical protein
VILRPALDPPVVPPELILRLHKYRDLAAVPQVIRRAAEEIATEASRLATPEAVIWRGPVTEADPGGAVTLAGAHHFRSRTLARLLSASSEAMVLVLTVGAAIEDRAKEMLDTNLLMEGVLMDTAGWAALEVVARDLRRGLTAAEKRHGRSLTHRTAPGYSDWGLEEQTALFRVFSDAPLPVTLNEAACMLPRKSISGVFGVIPARRG